MNMHASAPGNTLLDQVDACRRALASLVDEGHRARLGQYFTPAPVARFMASLLDPVDHHVRLLDAGAGVGALSAAVVLELCSRSRAPRSIHVTAFEVDPLLQDNLGRTLEACARVCASRQVGFTRSVVRDDFIVRACGPRAGERFNVAILNPPYAKLASSSAHRLALRKVGIQAPNLYAAFLALAVDLLEQDGQLVAITPRSFCNGVYFKPFRHRLLGAVSLRHLHVFTSRTQAFREDGVLQENMILHAVKGGGAQPTTRISTTLDLGESIHVPSTDVVHPADSGGIIHVPLDRAWQQAVKRVASLSTNLADLGLQVSTGPVVDFRLRQHLRIKSSQVTAPLIYPANLVHGFVEWPVRTRKAQAIKLVAATRRWLMPAGTYVVTKRISSKEERRRVVAAVARHLSSSTKLIGFENHLNVIHQQGQGMDGSRARGLTVFLNSTLVDHWLRHFSGHTQVNATDLRTLRFPAPPILDQLSTLVTTRFPDQEAIDRLMDRLLPAES